MDKPWVHIIGGGVASLSLARELANYPNLPGTLVISDPRSAYANDKTFSFWFRESERAQLKPENELKKWTISSIAKNTIMAGNIYHYGIRSAGNFYTEAIQKIDGHPMMKRKEEMLTKKPSAQFVFDSRPPNIKEHLITQSFYGTEVKLSEPHNLIHAGLMDDLESTKTGIRFRYALPLSEDRLLVEYTEFSTRPANLEALKILNHAWLEQQFADKFIELRMEAAHIPMGFKIETPHLGIPIGTRGGMTRAATGYGFSTMQHWASATAKALVSGQPPRQYPSSFLFSQMDGLLLQLIAKRPDVVPSIFEHLAEHLSGDQFAQFMMQTRLSDAIRVILSSPKKPFILAALGLSSWI